MRYERVLVALLCAVTVTYLVLLASCHSGNNETDVLPARAYLRGDLDRDGTPSVSDAIGILRIIVGLDPADDAADANGDGGTAVDDAIAVLRCIVGLDAWPIGEFDLPATRTIGPGIVAEVNFVVGADERVECLGDTTIECDTATIAGELYAETPGMAGSNGASITIDADGDVVVTGDVSAGSGSEGDPTGNEGMGGSGGDGGTVTINSRSGNVTIGAGVAPSAALPIPHLGGGDGGDGADGMLGGCGGAGGSVLINCPEGALTINQSQRLIHMGNGGDGGFGSVIGNTRAGFELPEALSNAGGNSGRFVFVARQLAGVEQIETGVVEQEKPVVAAVYEEGVFTGGVGGDAGDYEYGPEPVEEASAAAENRARSAQDYVRVYVAGCKGGEGTTKGGDGGSVAVDTRDFGFLGGQELPVSQANGGDGGAARYEFSTMESLFTWNVTHTAVRGGDGGNGRAVGANGVNGGPGQPGQNGAKAHGSGGQGGWVHVPRDYNWMQAEAGAGGEGRATGGNGGNGGANCRPVSIGGSGPGGDGGSGGEATAFGGDAGKIWETGRAPIPLAAAGDAYSFGGQGGDGGQGNPPGDGGPGGDAYSVGGRSTGDEIEYPGEAGSAGGSCPEPPAPTIDLAVNSGGSSGGYGGVIRIIRNLWANLLPGSAQLDEVLLGGSGNPVWVLVGQTIAFVHDNSRLFASTTQDAVFVYDDPMDGGNRPPNVALTPSGASEDCQPGALWYDALRDILYVAFGTDVRAWHSASTIGANRAADRTISVNGLAGFPAINAVTGAPGGDRLFIRSLDRVLVIDNASARNGVVDADRAFMTENMQGRGLAYDSTRDRIYLGARNGFTSEYVLVIVDNASQAQGQVVSTVVRGVGDLDHWPLAISVLSEIDCVLVALYEADVLLFRNAGSLDGESVPDDSLNVTAYSMGVRGGN